MATDTSSGGTAERSSAAPAGLRSPQRTCVGCHRTAAQHSLVRLTRTPDGRVSVDGEAERQPGRGAYLCPHRRCWEMVIERSGGLERALRGALSDADRRALGARGRQYDEQPAGDAGNAAKDGTA